MLALPFYTEPNNTGIMLPQCVILDSIPDAKEAWSVTALVSRPAGSPFLHSRRFDFVRTSAAGLTVEQQLGLVWLSPLQTIRVVHHVQLCSKVWQVKELPTSFIWAR